ncbi:aminoglycoside phosphotransferase family protein [Serinicoccus kebangsaanensis]|uniref:aminoglycoside phosphotransferase family protein n=1 Tax=Serinicoccus kebangsaanensis TaxID=2602069 RepID=UPI00124D1E44|nr:aminoglycoside phosphotransferase family protein [Serinicoccus kebangsaanensis]
MSTTSTPSPRAERALALATTLATEHGLPTDDLRVLHDSFSVIVHLAPAPVVLRVPTLTVLPLAADVAQRQREVDVTAWLAGQDFPVVAPSDLLPAEVHVVEDVAVTAWRWVEHRDEGFEPEVFLRRMPLVAQLHRALADYPGTLAEWVPLEGCESMLDDVAAAGSLPAEDVARARRELAVVRERCSSVDGLVPTHGDAPYYNALVTPRGTLVGDLEHVGLAPVEWDLVGCSEEMLAAYTAAGGADLDPERLSLMGVARNVQLVAAHAFVPSVPELGTGMAPLIEAWRESPEIT